MIEASRFYRAVRQFAVTEPVWSSDRIVVFSTPGDRYDLTRISQRVYGNRDEFLTVMAAAGLTRFDDVLMEQELVLPARERLAAIKQLLRVYLGTVEVRALMAATKRNDMIISAQKALAEAAARLREADAIRSKSDTLLRPDDILEGQVDAGKLWKYMTTRDGAIRPLTMDDLLEFSRLAERLRKRYKKGIKPRDVIDLSLSADLDRARKQINTGIPITTKAGEIRFMTNAGPGSDVRRHYVTVRLLNFEAAVVSASPPEKIVKEVINGPCAVSCDCGRWRFWYAYMATIGGYNANPNHREGAFPKIRNPKLHGLACKHILRVMTNLTQTATIKQYVINLIRAERDKVQSPLKREAQANMRLIEEQLRKENSRKRQIQTTAEKRSKRAAQPSYQRQQAARKAAAELRAKAKQKPAAGKVVNEAKQIAVMMDQFGWTREQAQAAIASARANRG